MDSRPEFAQNYQQSKTSSSASHTTPTSATSGGPVTPRDQYSLSQIQSSFDLQFDLSPTSESFNNDEYKGLADDYFLNEFVRQEPLTSKRNSDGLQNGFEILNPYSTQYQQYQPSTNGNWSASPSSTTSQPVRKLHDYSSRKSSTQTNSNLSYTSSPTPASQFDRFLTLTPLTTPGNPGSYQPSSQGFPFYSNAINSQNMSSTQSPLDSLSEEPQWVSTSCFPSPSQPFPCHSSKTNIDKFLAICV